MKKMRYKIWMFDLQNPIHAQARTQTHRTGDSPIRLYEKNAQLTANIILIKEMDILNGNKRFNIFIYILRFFYKSFE